MLCGLAILVISCGLATLLPGAGGATLTATPSSSSTAAPTDAATPSPSSTPSPFPTAPLTSPSPDPLDARAPLDCKVLSQSVRNGARFGPRERFEVGWKVKNNGTLTWEPATFAFVYFSGTRMYQAAQYPVPTEVARGDTVALGASMMAPKSSGSYTTVWSLRSGKDYFCYVTLRIIVP